MFDDNICIKCRKDRSDISHGLKRCTFVSPVKRFVVTHINKDGMRTLCGPQQGRNTFETFEEANNHLLAMIKNNSSETLLRFYGLPLTVEECACYPGHFDPIGIYF